MELTRKFIRDQVCREDISLETSIDVIWQSIEADRQRVRDEAIAQVKKDHYALGEKLVDPSGIKWAVIVRECPDGQFVMWPSGLTRPPKTRPMTDMEKARAWVDNYAKKYPGNPWETLSNILLSGATIADACKSDNVPTEVPE